MTGHAPGPGIGLVACSGYVPDAAAIGRVEAYFAARGCRVVVDATCHGQWTRFSGSDAERAAALHRMATTPEVDVVLAVRGGYGFSRILDRLDYAALAESGKVFAGHSDFTAFQLALLRRTGGMSLAGPAGVYDFGGETVDPFTESHFWGLLRSRDYEVGIAAETRLIGEFEGTVWGGNLSLVSHLVGTPYLPLVEGGILFLEDVNEHPYRVERMLLQLLHAGVLDAQSLILLGEFSAYQTTDYDNGFDLPSVLDFIASRTRTPIVSRFPFGHVRAKITVPVGAHAQVRVARDHYRVRFSDYPTLLEP